MKTVLSLTLASAIAASGFALTASAQSGRPDPAVSARQGYMSLISLNLGVLGDMARGNTEYDAEAAQAAADNMVTLSSLDQRFDWPEGTDSESIEGTRALPAIWENREDFDSHFTQLNEGAQAMAAVAGDGLDAVRASMGALGGSCGACHDDYRAER